MTQDSRVQVARPRLTLAGRERDDLAAAITSLVVNQPLQGSAHAEIHCTNWGVPEGQRQPDFLFTDIKLGDALDIFMAGNERQATFSGEITALEEVYGEGAPTLVLLVQDSLQRLARVRRCRSYEDQSLNDVFSAVARESGLQTELDLPSFTASWHQVNESDLAFLLRLASQFDLAVRLQDGKLRVKAEEDDANPVSLDPQDSATYVRLIADLNRQPAQVSVTGYNLADDVATEATATQFEPALTGRHAKDTLKELGWTADDNLPLPFARSSAEAKAYAHAHLHRMGRRFIAGDIRCLGEANLRAGREIELENVSPRLQGRYRILHCSHCFDNQNGYENFLKVERGGWQP